MSRSTSELTIAAEFKRLAKDIQSSGAIEGQSKRWEEAHRAFEVLGDPVLRRLWSSGKASSLAEQSSEELHEDGLKKRGPFLYSDSVVELRCRRAAAAALRNSHAGRAPPPYH